MEGAELFGDEVLAQTVRHAHHGLEQALGHPRLAELGAHGVVGDPFDADPPTRGSGKDVADLPPRQVGGTVDGLHTAPGPRRAERVRRPLPR